MKTDVFGLGIVIALGGLGLWYMGTSGMEQYSTLQLAFNPQARSDYRMYESMVSWGYIAGFIGVIVTLAGLVLEENKPILQQLQQQFSQQQYQQQYPQQQQYQQRYPQQQYQQQPRDYNCPNCNLQVKNGTQFCPSCGTKILN